MNAPICDIMTCDEIVRNYLPQLRAELVCRLVQRKGIPQARVAKWMGMSRAAVCQYMSRKRGSRDIHITDDLNEIIESWAEGVITGEGSVTICDICRCIQEIKVAQGDDTSTESGSMNIESPSYPVYESFREEGTGNRQLP